MKNTITFKPPKTAKGRRQIAHPEITVDALRKHRAEQAKERLQMGKGYVDQDLVFANVNGDVWLPDKLTDAFRRLVRTADLGHVRLHDPGTVTPPNCLPKASIPKSCRNDSATPRLRSRWIRTRTCCPGSRKKPPRKWTRR